MTKMQPIDPHNRLHTTQPSEDVVHLSKQMRTYLNRFSEHLQQTIDNPSLSKDKDFQQEFGKNILQLNRTIEKSLLLK